MLIFVFCFGVKVVGVLVVEVIVGSKIVFSRVIERYFLWLDIVGIFVISEW